MNPSEVRLSVSYKTRTSFRGNRHFSTTAGPVFYLELRPLCIYIFLKLYVFITICLDILTETVVEIETEGKAVICYVDIF